MTVETGIRSLRRSPLAHRAGELEAVAGGVTLSEVPFLSMVSLRVDPESAAAGRVAEALGRTLPAAGQVSTAPAGPAGADDRGGAGRAVAWLGPDEWLVIGPDGDTAEVISLLQAAIGDDLGSVTDVSANRTTMLLSGPMARDLLEKGCTLDLHPRSFTAGHCAQTTFARGHLLIWQTHPEGTTAGPAYRLLFRGSFADYFADWLLDAATEYTAG